MSPRCVTSHTTPARHNAHQRHPGPSSEASLHSQPECLDRSGSEEPVPQPREHTAGTTVVAERRKGVSKRSRPSSLHTQTKSHGYMPLKGNFQHPLIIVPRGLFIPSHDGGGGEVTLWRPGCDVGLCVGPMWSWVCPFTFPEPLGTNTRAIS